MKRESIKTPISEIVDFWAERIDESDLSVDWSEADEYCWNCGSPRDLTRCHIVPHSLGGADEPSNFVVLCRSCHAEAPNVADPEIIWDWLRAHKSPFYKTYWIQEARHEYEFIYKRSIEQEIGFILDGTEPDAHFAYSLIEDALLKSARHFGQSAPNRATGAGVMRMWLKEYAASFGKTLPDGGQRNEGNAPFVEV